MGSKSPTPPPKFNIGDIVYFKDVAYRVTNRRYTIGPWKYDIEEQNARIPRHKLVMEDLLMSPPLQVPAKFTVGQQVVYQAEVFEINSMFWHIDDKWKYNLLRHLPEEKPETDTRCQVLEKYLQIYVPNVPNTGHFDDVEGVWVDEPNPFEGRTVVNEKGGRQSLLSARFDCIPPVVLRLLAQCLGFGARKYGDTNYQNISLQDHLNHAMNHINEWNRGDRSEPHLVNAMARLTFALWHAVEQKQQPDTYIHPDEKPS